MQKGRKDLSAQMTVTQRMKGYKMKRKIIAVVSLIFATLATSSCSIKEAGASALTNATVAEPAMTTAPQIKAIQYTEIVTNIPPILPSAERSAESIASDTKGVEAAVLKAIEMSVSISETSYISEEMNGEIYEIFDLESFYYIATRKKAPDYKTVMQYLKEHGFDLSQIYQIASSSPSSEKAQYNITNSAPITDDEYTDVYHILYNYNNMTNGAYPHIEQVLEALEVEDVWVSTVRTYNKATDAAIELYNEMKSVYDVYGVELNNGYFVSDIPFVVFKRNGEWRADLAFTSLYATGRLIESGVLDNLADPYASAFREELKYYN